MNSKILTKTELKTALTNHINGKNRNKGLTQHTKQLRRVGDPSASTLNSPFSVK
jgi:hypothetical protein